MALRPITYARDFLTKIRFRKNPTSEQRSGFLAMLASTEGGAPAVGEPGQVITSKIATGDATALTTATAKTVTSITLTPGNWLVSGNVNVTYTGATRTVASAGINTTNNTLPTDGTEVPFGTPTTTATFLEGVSLEAKPIYVASGTQVVYLVATSTFSAGSAAAYGSITAVRQL